MNRKPSRAFPAVLRDNENRVGGKRNRFVADFNNANIDAVLRPDDNVLTFCSQSGENNLCKYLRRDFTDFRHFRALFFLFFHDGSFD